MHLSTNFRIYELYGIEREIIEFERECRTGEQIYFRDIIMCMR